MTPENYAHWFAPTVARSMEEKLLVVVVPTAFHGHWLDTRLRTRIDASLRRLGHAGVRVTFVAAP